jgi:delta11-fatty-acid desaturase
MVTKIHGKYYNLSKFKHPAGNIPIALAADRDATELFESHHLFSDREKIYQILEKYEVKNIKYDISDNNEFDWSETLHSEFTKELKQILKESFDNKNIKASWSEWVIIGILFLIYFANLIYYYNGSYIALLLYPLSLWVFTVNIYHDSSHFALSHNPIINKLGTYTALMFSLTYCWYHQHVIGHHCFVNVLTRDPDLYHSPLYVRHTPNIRKNKYHVYQYISAWFIWLLAVPLGLVYTGFVKCLEDRAYNKVVKLSRNLDKRSMYYEMIFVMIYMVILPYIYTGKMLFVLYPYVAYSFLFMICTQINHLTEDSFANHKNFFIHQIINSHNVAPRSWLMNIFTGGLNLQIEHHLMPSVNHFHLMKIQPKIEALCKKHGIRYNTSNTLWEALYKHYKHLVKYSFHN